MSAFSAFLYTGFTFEDGSRLGHRERSDRVVAFFVCAGNRVSARVYKYRCAVATQGWILECDVKFYLLYSYLEKDVR